MKAKTTTTLLSNCKCHKEAQKSQISFCASCAFLWLISFCALLWLITLPVYGQEPVVVQPGAPGRPTQTLPSSTRATLPPHSPADVQFIQDMIMHHTQAVEMTALIESRTKNKEVRSLGARISHSQA